jgi:DNA-binding response OmpR family regulator
MAGKNKDQERILLVEDDWAVIKLLTDYLGRNGYDVTSVGKVDALRRLVETIKIDLIILNVVLPDEDGWSALCWLRARSAVPVVMLTGEGNTVDKVIGFDVGADDYVAKPIDLHALLARLRRLLHRARLAQSPIAGSPQDKIKFAEWILDMATQQLRSKAGDAVHLTPAEYQTLFLLAQNPYRVMSRDQLMRAIAGRDWKPFDRNIDVHVSNLRRKLDPDLEMPSLIRTVRNVGYMFVPSRGS